MFDLGTEVKLVADAMLGLKRELEYVFFFFIG